MLLAFDAGNSRLSAGLFVGDESRALWHWPRVQASDPAWLAAELEGALASSSVEPEAIEALAVASVIRALSASLAAACREVFGREPDVLDANAPYGLNLEAVDAGSVGADRLAEAGAAVQLFGAPVIVVDVGTAITVDLVDARSIFRGGAILPGPRLMYDALHRGTDLLPELSPAPPPGPVGTMTSAAIHAGVGYGAAGAIERLMAAQRELIGAQAPVVITGGLAELILPLVPKPAHYVADLVLRGVAWVASREQA